LSANLYNLQGFSSFGTGFQAALAGILMSTRVYAPTLRSEDVQRAGVFCENWKELIA
jgi:hypothetical protein